MPLSSLFLVRENALLKFLKSLIYTVVLDTIYENNTPWMMNLLFDDNY